MGSELKYKILKIAIGGDSGELMQALKDLSPAEKNEFRTWLRDMENAIDFLRFYL